MFDVILTSTASTGEPSLLGFVGITALFGLWSFLYLRQKLYRCPECSFRADYDHIAEVNEDNPYCPHCGTHTEYIGRKYERYLARLGGGSR